MNARALILVAPRRVAVRDLPLEEPAPGQARLRTRLSAISSGSELLVYRGEAPSDLTADATLAALSGGLAYPLSYGYASVGVVEQVGSAADRHWIGRRAFAFQPHASQFNAALADLQPVPEGVHDEDAVFLANTETAIGLLHDGAPLAGERLAVWGQGIVGLLTTSLLAGLPLERLIALDPIRLRREAALSLGASAALDPTAPEADVALRTALGGEGADLSYELSGSPPALDAALQAAAFSGRVVLGSWYGTKRVSLDLGGGFHRSHVRLMASQVSRIDPPLTGRWTKARRLAFAWEWLARIKPSRWITHRFDLETAADAYSLLDEQPEQALQVVLTYPEA